MFNLDIEIENQQVILPILKEKKVELFIKREDKIHPDVSGNKFRKLKYNILQAKKLGHHKVLTFGGAYSNHILATSVAAHKNDLSSLGIVRGDELKKDLDKVLKTNPTLRKASDFGMQFYFVSREQYRDKMNPRFIRFLHDIYKEFYLIPEGGANELAVKGCEEILTKEDDKFDFICCAIGTGGTVSGIINSSKKHQQILGFSALKGDFLYDDIQKFVTTNRWELITGYHFGGYAKYNDDLISFINNFKKETTVSLDPVYTGKMLYGILDLVKNDYFSPQSRILAIHTGGLQGIQGFNNRLQKKNFTQLIQ